MKNTFLLAATLFFVLFSFKDLYGQDTLTIQLQVGEELQLAERLGNCVTAQSYQLSSDIPEPFTFIDEKVNVSNLGSVYGQFTLIAPFDISPGIYSGQLVYEIYEFGGTLCFTDTLMLAITVVPAQPPVPEFRTFPRTIIEGAVVEFENLSQNPVSDWLWDFGDGNTSTLKSPTNTYVTAGLYTVSLTATGPGGIVVATKTDYIEVVEPGAPGLPVWSFSTEGYVNSPAIGIDGTIYCSSAEGYTYALAPDGSERWKSELFIRLPVVGQSNTIYGSNGTTFFALDQDGKEKWRVEAQSTINLLFALGQDETLYFGTTSGILHAVDSSGVEQWTLDLDQSYPGVHHPVVGPDGTIYVIVKSKVIAINPDGTVKWEFDSTSVSALSIARSGNVLISGSPITALDPDGEVVWRYFLHNSASQLVSDANGKIYGISGLKIFCFDPYNQDIRWDLDLLPYLPGTRRDLAPPLIGADGRIYTYSKAGVAFGISEQGELLWQHTLVPDDFQPNVYVFNGAPAMGAMGMLYIGYDDGALHAISTESSGLLEGFWSKRGQNNQNTNSYACPFPTLYLPRDQVVDQSIETTFHWRSLPVAVSYEIEIGQDSTFAEVQHTQVLADTSVQFNELAYGSTYFWRVRPLLEENETGCWSTSFSFSTIQPPCDPCGSCTTDIATINDDPIPDGTTVAASDWIETAGTIELGSTVSLQAANYIRLLPGFHAQPGSEMTLRIADCSAATAELIAFPIPPPRMPKSTLALHPNPASFTVNITYELHAPQRVSIGLQSLNGQRMKYLIQDQAREAGTWKLEVNGGELPAGTYVVFLETDRERVARKLVIVRF